MPGLLGCLILAAAVAGCADTPTRRGLPWWSQGPGDAAAQAPRVDAPRSPAAPAASRHPQAVRHGDLLFVSGQLADESGSTVSGRDIQVQVRAAMENVKHVLESHGLAMSNVVSVTLYLQDIDELARVDEVYSSYFRRDLPARSVVRVSGLPKDSLVEISVIAGK